MPRVTIDGMTFHYLQSGAGPDVVLIHGLTGDLSLWLLIDLVETLATDFRVTIYDLRGHGYTDVPATGYTSADMAEDLLHLHRALGLGPTFVVGHSFGAVIGLHAALKYPQMVVGGVLSDPYFPGLRTLEAEGSKLVGRHETDDAQAAIWHRFRETCVRLGAPLPDATNFDMGQLLRQMALLLPGAYERLESVFGAVGLRLEEMHWSDFGALIEQINALPPEAMEVLRAEAGAAQTQRLIRLAGTTCGPDVRAPAGLTAAAIATIRQPMVALYGQHSPFLATCRFLATTLPGCRVELVPGAKHLAPLENSTEFVRLVRRHLRLLAGLEAAASPESLAGNCPGVVPCTS